MMNCLFTTLLFGTNSRPDLETWQEMAKPARKECISPSVASPSKFGTDVESLQARYGEMRSGLCIETTLRELLEVCPRKRARTDSYNSLVSYLKVEFGVSLLIKTQKRK